MVNEHKTRRNQTDFSDFICHHLKFPQPQVTQSLKKELSTPMNSLSIISLLNLELLHNSHTFKKHLMNDY